MNENIDLVEILKNVPEGTKLWSSVYGEVTLDEVEDAQCMDYPIYVRRTDGELEAFARNGCLYVDYKDAECVLFPSKDQRDWSKFNTKNRTEFVELKPFYCVLVRDTDDGEWYPNLFSRKYKDQEYPYEVLTGAQYRQVIPYNKDTAKLAFTNKSPDRKYIITDVRVPRLTPDDH